MAKKYTYEEVKQIIESHGYKLISTEYINCKTKIEVECPDGHRYFVTFDVFCQGNRCPECSNNTPRDYEYVKSTIESYGYKLLSPEYINCKTKIELECKDYKHTYFVTFDKFCQGNRCPICKYINMKGENNPNWNPNREEIALNDRIRKSFDTPWVIKHMKEDRLYNDYVQNPDIHCVDHKEPIAAFCKLIKIFQEDYLRDMANHRSNLQILTRTDNGKKSDKYNTYSFINYVMTYTLGELYKWLLGRKH